MPLYQILLETDPLPTDPILLRRDLMPSDPANVLGRELKVAIRSFFNTQSPPRAPGLRVQKANRRSYEAMVEVLEFFDTINQPVSDRREAPTPPLDRPARTPEPSPEPRAVLPPPDGDEGVDPG